MIVNNPAIRLRINPIMCALLDASADAGNRLCAQDIMIPNPNNDIVSGTHRCETEAATKLCIFDINKKLISDGRYDIGGTYLNETSDFWFYFTTSSCPKQIYLLSLFFRCKSPRNFSIGISDSVNINMVDGSNKIMTLSENLKWYSFRSVDSYENHYFKTFCFSKKDTKDLHSLSLFIPICIRSETGLNLSPDILRSIKLQHDLGALISKQEKPDFILTSASGTQFPAHKIILAAHSSVLKSLIKEDSNSLLIDINDTTMDMLLQFLYTGTIKDVSKQGRQLLEIAKKFKVHALFLLAQQIIGDHIDIDNAIEVAIVAKKFNLEKLLHKATDFIRNHPEIAKTSGWLELNDIELMKYFFEHINYKQV
ncbi:hypothetical protein K1T71_002998 [Dendrolimus kikuchii]|uniref:Uncharacterized protein n=1 Tax=Dendrolimus kikuchii TaxID=765133 RepID=A0ACC1DBD7_9NEOP|nr:hypothetical protein K1T71_002998 [Dendrolimus kikuchii]